MLILETIIETNVKQSALDWENSCITENHNMSSVDTDLFSLQDTKKLLERFIVASVVSLRLS